MRASRLITRGRVQNPRERFVKETGRYPHFSSATEKHPFSPPRAGRKGIRIRSAMACATHMLRKRKHKSYFTCHFRKCLHLVRFFRSWTHNDALGRRDKVLMTCAVAFTHALPPSSGTSDVCPFCLKAPNAGAPRFIFSWARRRWAHVCMCVVTSRAVPVRVAAKLWGVTIRKTLITTHGCPDVPEFPHCLARFYALRLPKVTTRAHHTRFTAVAGPGFAAGCR